VKKRVGFLILILFLVSAVVLAAQIEFGIRWWSVDGGAGASSGDGYVLSGIIGQPDGGPAMSNGSFTVSGGYWKATVSGDQMWEVYLPILISPP
jgi:hypothetical protein